MVELLKKTYGGDFIKRAKEISRFIKKDDADEYEIFIASSLDNEIEVFNSDVESMSHSDSSGIGIRIIKDKRSGYAFCTSFDEKDITECIQKAVSNSKITSAEEEKLLPSYEEFKYQEKADIEEYMYSDKFFGLDIEGKISLLKELEVIAKSKDKRITGVDSLNYSDNFSSTAIVNSNGFEGCYQSTSCFLFLNLISKKRESTSTGFSFEYKRDPYEFNLDKIASQAAEKSLMLLGAEKIKSSNSNIILDCIPASQFIGLIASALNADSVQKGRSLFKDKIGQKIFKDNIDIFDDGIMREGFASKPFDGEGVNKGKTIIFEKGILKTYLYDTYTARKDKTLSTGNAVRASYRSPSSVGASNFYLKPSNLPFKEMLKILDNGFYVTDIIGLHSGANPVSGDISVGAKGIWIKNGEFFKPVREVTIATDIISFCSKIDMVAEDLTFFPSGGYTGSPGLLLREISISGI